MSGVVAPQRVLAGGAGRDHAGHGRPRAPAGSAPASAAARRAPPPGARRPPAPSRAAPACRGGARRSPPVVGQQAQGRRQPARSDRRRSRGRLMSCLLEDRRRCLVAHARGALDVVRSRRDRARPRRERLGGARVRAPAATPPPPPHRRRGARSDGGTRSAAAPWSPAARRAPPAPPTPRARAPRSAPRRPWRDRGPPDLRRPPRPRPAAARVAQAVDLLPERRGHRGGHADRGLSSSGRRAGRCETRASSWR